MTYRHKHHRLETFGPIFLKISPPHSFFLFGANLNSYLKLIHHDGHPRRPDHVFAVHPGLPGVTMLRHPVLRRYRHGVLLGVSSKHDRGMVFAHHSRIPSLCSAYRHQHVGLAAQ